MLVETYSKTGGGVDKVCIMIPPDLVPGQFKFEAYVHKAHEQGNITVGAPSLRPLTVDESFEQVGLKPPSFTAVVILIFVISVIGLFKAGK